MPGLYSHKTAITCSLASNQTKQPVEASKAINEDIDDVPHALPKRAIAF